MSKLEPHTNHDPQIANPSVAALYEDALVYETGSAITASGALSAYSGAKTGRSPSDKRIVEEDSSKNDVWWGPVNKPMKSDVSLFFLRIYPLIPKPIRQIAPALLACRNQWQTSCSHARPIPERVRILARGAPSGARLPRICTSLFIGKSITCSDDHHANASRLGLAHQP